jgi:hypothetical protein
VTEDEKVRQEEETPAHDQMKNVEVPDAESANVKDGVKTSKRVQMRMKAIERDPSKAGE